MPYKGLSDSQSKKLDECVVGITGTNKRTGKPYTKSEKIAICRSSMGLEKDMEEIKYEYNYDTEVFAKGKLLQNVEILREGTFKGIEWTKEKMLEAIENFKKLKETAGLEPPVRIGHRGENSAENVKNVVGYIDSLSLTEVDGEARMVADMDIVEEDFLKDVEKGKYRKRSIEFGLYEDNDGNEFLNVLWGVGFVDIPQVERLAEVAVYSKTMEALAKEPDEELEEEDKEEAKEEDKTDDSENKEEDKGEEQEQLDKKDETITLSREEFSKLEKAKQELNEKLDKERFDKRESDLGVFVADAKISQEMSKNLEGFVKALPEELYGQFKGFVESLPKLVELDKEYGKTKSKKTDESKTAEERVAYAQDVVKSKLKTMGYSDEEIKKELEKTEKKQFIL